MCFINQTPWTPPLRPSSVPQQQTWCPFCCPPSVHLLWKPPPTLLWGCRLHGRKPGVPACPGPPLPAAATRTGLNIWPESVQSRWQPQELPCNVRTGMLTLFHLGFEPGNSLPRTAGRQLATRRRTCKVQSQQQKKKKTPQTKIKLEFPSLSPDQARLAKAPPESLQEQAVSFP